MMKSAFINSLEIMGKKKEIKQSHEKKSINCIFIPFLMINTINFSFS